MSPARATADAVRRARPGHPGAPSSRTPGGASRTASPAPRSLRRLWLVGLVPGLLVGVLAGGAVGSLVAPDGTAPGDASPAAVNSVDARVAELEAEAATRDAEAITLLTDQATDLLDTLGPVVTGAGAHVVGPEPGATVPPVPTAGDVDSWRASLVAGQAIVGDPPSAGTGVNVARAGFVAALGDLTTAVDALALAVETAAAGGDPEPAQRLAGSALRGAAATWSVGATQLDAVNVEAGNGHVHVYLPPVAGSGALTADPEPTGRTESPE